MQTLRAALVGFGFIAEKGHLPAYLASMRSGGPFELVAVADGCAARRELARRLVPEARVYSDYGAILAGELGRVDFLDIATPPCDHASIASAALERGLHVLCEKPLTSSLEAARELIARADRTGRVVFPCHNYRHAPVVKTVRRVLDSGVIGDVRLVTLQTFRHAHARGVDEWRPDWRRERTIAGGGIAMDHGSHSFYLAFDWMGAYPSSVAASTSTAYGRDTEDNVACTMRFPGNRLATAYLSWTAGMRRVLYTVHGARGAIRVEDDEVEVVTAEEDGVGPLHWESESALVASGWMDASHSAWFRSVLDDFAAAIARRDLTSTDAEDAVRCIEVIDATYRSARDGGREIALSGAESLMRSFRSRARVHRVSA
jgi:predicted dehydrogenase